MTLQTIDTRTRRAIVFTPMESRREVLIAGAVRAEELGYEAVVVPEGWGLDASVVLAEIAMRTSRIRIVAGILSVWSRTPAMLAMTAATLDDLSNGRFSLGLGASTPQLVEGFHGEPFVDPAARLRRSVCGVRQLLQGDRAPTAHGRGLRLGQPARPSLPLWVAGLGDRSVEVATTLGDAWFPAAVPASSLPALCERAALSANPHCEIVTAVLSGHTKHDAQQILAWYLTGMGSLYGDHAARHGLAHEVDAVRRANPEPRPGSLEWPAEADPLLDEMALYGDFANLSVWDRLTDVVGVVIGPASCETVMQIIDAAAP